MSEISRQAVMEILEQHQKWLENHEEGKKAKFENIDFSKMNIDFSNMNLYCIDFVLCNFSGVCFDNANLLKVGFYGCDLSFASMEKVVFQNGEIMKCICEQSIFRNTNLNKVLIMTQKFNGSDFTFTKLNTCNMRIVNFEYCNCSNMETQTTYIKRTSMFHSNLSNANYNFVNENIELHDCITKNLKVTIQY